MLLFVGMDLMSCLLFIKPIEYFYCEGNLLKLILTLKFGVFDIVSSSINFTERKLSLF